MMRIVHLGVAALAGLAAGLGVFTFIYAKGASYLGHDPAACANCHVMHDEYNGWIKSSHRSVATCNDCHTPHAFIPKYMVKAENGFRHSLFFTLGNYHDPIRITPRNRRVTENACRHCHEDIVQEIDATPHREPISCIRCHGSVGHPSPGMLASRMSREDSPHAR